MFRLLKYIPVVLPLISKFVKSPRGQKAIADVRARISRKNGPASPQR
jgi:hypothetical protein